MGSIVLRHGRYESDSAGKTFTAAAIGAAVGEGLIDLDTPLAAYNVTPRANWNHTGTDFYPQLTARHLLSQSHGIGLERPGTFFTYESDDYIQHLSFLLDTVTQRHLNMSAVQFASDRLATPLGVPQLWAFDGLGDQISAGGGQMVTCRGLMRLGQLILNKGAWPGLGQGGRAGQLIPASYVDDLQTPHYPTNRAYGFLTWLNLDVGEAHCCAPVWGGRAKHCNGTDCTMCCTRNGTANPNMPCTVRGKMLNTLSNYCSRLPGVRNISDRRCHRWGSQYVDGHIIGSQGPGLARAPADTLIVMGQDAKYLIVVPSLNISVVTLGQTSGTSLQCEGAYDDAATLSVIWDQLSSAVTPRRAPAPEPAPAPTLGGVLPPSRRATGGVRGRGGGGSTEGAAAAAAAAAAGPPYMGSCSCVCGQNGFGKCFNVPAATPPTTPYDCSTVPGWTLPNAPLERAAEYCPASGVMQACRYPADASVGVCAKGCVQLHACRPVHNGSGVAVANCRCYSGPSFGACTWSNATCAYSPYFPPLA